MVTSTGTISPVNTAVIIPGSDGTVFSVTAVNVTRLFPINLKEGMLFALPLTSAWAAMACFPRDAATSLGCHMPTPT